MCARRFKAGAEWVTSPSTAEQAGDVRHALAKLVSAWHHHSVEHEMCARTLRRCADADADGAAGPKQEL